MKKLKKSYINNLFPTFFNQKKMEKKEVTSKSKIVHEELWDYITKMIMGIYSSFAWSMACQKKINVMGLQVASTTLLSLITKHLNELYIHLIKRDDKEITDIFDEFSKKTGHSHICLLEKVMNGMLKCLSSIRIKKLNIKQLDDAEKTYKNYMSSLIIEMGSFRDSMIDILNKSILHECKKSDITKEDPSKPLFTFELQE